MDELSDKVDGLGVQVNEGRQHMANVNEGMKELIVNMQANLIEKYEQRMTEMTNEFTRQITDLRQEINRTNDSVNSTLKGELERAERKIQELEDECIAKDMRMKDIEDTIKVNEEANENEWVKVVKNGRKAPGESSGNIEYRIYQAGEAVGKGAKAKGKGVVAGG